MNSMRPYLVIAAFSGFSAVLLGAMGSHFLSSYMSGKGPDHFQLANIYHLIHSLALFGCAMLMPTAQKTKKTAKYLKLSVAFFIAGTLLFCGILYYVAVSPGFTLHYLIPLGGLCFMIGWLMLAGVALSLKKT